MDIFEFSVHLQECPPPHLPFLLIAIQLFFETNSSQPEVFDHSSVQTTFLMALEGLDTSKEFPNTFCIDSEVCFC